MTGIASLFGGSSVKADRNAELAARGDLTSAYNYALPTGENLQASGSAASNDAAAGFNQMLTAGRTQTAENAAPAINSELSAADAAKRREALTGTGRTGGTAEADRMAAGTTEGKIDNTINQTTQADKTAGEQGLASVGAQQMSQAGNLLSTGGQEVNSVLGNTLNSEQTSQNIRQQTYGGVGTDVGNLISNFL
jgi:hypothetical protein